MLQKIKQKWKAKAQWQQYNTAESKQQLNARTKETKQEIVEYFTLHGGG